MKPRILVGIPHHPSRPWAFGHFMESAKLLALGTQNAIVDVLVRHDPNPTYGAANNVKNQREALREAALMGGYDYLFMHGDDTIPPPDAIDNLLRHNKPVVSGVYYNRSEVGSGNVVAWMDGVDSRAKDAFITTAFGLVEVAGHGLDCALIRRDALEAVSWRDWDVNDDDWPWCDRIKARGMKLYLDADVSCRHYEKDGSYTKSGRFYAPA